MPRDPHQRLLPTQDEALLDRTQRLYSGRYSAELTREDAREILTNLTGFFGVLRQMERAAAGQTSPSPDGLAGTP